MSKHIVDVLHKGLQEHPELDDELKNAMRELIIYVDRIEQAAQRLTYHGWDMASATKVGLPYPPPDIDTVIRHREKAKLCKALREIQRLIGEAEYGRMLFGLTGVEKRIAEVVNRALGGNTDDTTCRDQAS